MSEWISVEDRLPEDDEQYLIYPHYYTAAFLREFIADKVRYNTGWYRPTDMWPLHKVTHWMPLPEPPPKQYGDGI